MIEPRSRRSGGATVTEGAARSRDATVGQGDRSARQTPSRSGAKSHAAPEHQVVEMEQRPLRRTRRQFDHDRGRRRRRVTEQIGDALALERRCRRSRSPPARAARCARWVLPQPGGPPSARGRTPSGQRFDPGQRLAIAGSGDNILAPRRSAAAAARSKVSGSLIRAFRAGSPPQIDAALAIADERWARARQSRRRRHGDQAAEKAKSDPPASRANMIHTGCSPPGRRPDWGDTHVAFHRTGRNRQAGRPWRRVPPIRRKTAPRHAQSAMTRRRTWPTKGMKEMAPAIMPMIGPKRPATTATGRGP